MSKTIQGSCYCGSVAFEVDLPPRFVAHCHCANCRRAHGAGFVTWAGVVDGQFRVTREGELKTWISDTGATRSFCGNCGSPLFFAHERWAGETHVAVACLHESLEVLPQVHAYADRSPDWCPITDDLPRYGGDSGTEPLLKS